MKRFLCILILIVIIPLSVFADNSAQRKWKKRFLTLDVSELQDVIAAASSLLLSKSEYENVTVPVGFYVVGEDIPAGHWSISFSPGEYAIIEYFLETDPNGKRPADLLNDYYSEVIADPDSSYSVMSKLSEIDLDLKDGYHLIISNGSVIFNPFVRRSSPFY